jgi:hypothetical protein
MVLREWQTLSERGESGRLVTACGARPAASIARGPPASRQCMCAEQLSRRGRRCPSASARVGRRHGRVAAGRRRPPPPAMEGSSDRQGHAGQRTRGTTWYTSSSAIAYSGGSSSCPPSVMTESVADIHIQKRLSGTKRNCVPSLWVCAKCGMTLLALAAAHADLVAEVVAAHLSVAEMARGPAQVCRAFAEIARSDVFWERRFRAHAWRVAPEPVPGHELVARWAVCAPAGELSVRDLKDELRLRFLTTEGLFEKGDLIDAVNRARACDIKSLGGWQADGGQSEMPGLWREIFKGLMQAEVLRTTLLLSRPMRANVLRHFLGANAQWDSGWRERWLEVDGDVFSVFESERSHRPLAAVDLCVRGHDAVALPVLSVPDGRPTCFSMTGLGVEVAFDAGCERARAAWLERIKLHWTRIADEGSGAKRCDWEAEGTRWRRVGLTREGAAALGGLLHRLGLSESVLHPEKAVVHSEWPHAHDGCHA